MVNLFEPPPVIETEVFTSMPDSFRRPGARTEWAEANKGGAEVDCFIEGPAFDRDGNLYVVDIPFGRIFRISPAGGWALAAEYDGEPNGLKIHRDGRIFVADYRNGLLRLDPGSGRVVPVLPRRNSERFKGLNDLTFAANGDLYFTDQGQTGLHDPTGRVYRLSPDGRLDCLIANVPSPNGLVLNLAENVLYVAVTRGNSIWRLPLMRDGSISKVGLFFQFYGSSGPDGLALDQEDNLVVAHASLGSAILLSRRGEPLYRIRSCRGATVTNAAFGGDDGRTLYLTESETGSILVARLPVAGRPMYSHQ
jgi:gluconolactonase